MTDEGREIESLKPTAADEHLSAARALLTGLGMLPVISSITGAALETLPSPVERQHEQALRTLFTLVGELEELVTAADWRNAIGTEEFDAAWVRSLGAAHRAQSEAKREFVWLALINGYVRTGGDPERDRFLRLVEKYDVEHIQALAKLQKLAPQHPTWPDVEGKMLPTIGGEHSTAYAYVQEFDADGLVRRYYQPELRDQHQFRRGDKPYSIESRDIALWTDRADRFLEFVRDPRGMLRPTDQSVGD